MALGPKLESLSMSSQWQTPVLFCIALRATASSVLTHLFVWGTKGAISNSASPAEANSCDNISFFELHLYILALLHFLRSSSTFLILFLRFPSHS